MAGRNGKSKGSEMEVTDLTPTERKMFRVLEDRKDHTREELHACLWDQEGSINNIQMHISNLRRKVAPLSMEILCVVRGYQHLYRMIEAP